VTGYLEPTALFLGVAGGGPPAKLKELPAFFDARGLAVTQHEAVSTDGTRIPYFQVARARLAQDGSNPTAVYGYGGFEISEGAALQRHRRCGVARARRRVRRCEHPRWRRNSGRDGTRRR
jgi:prolyl oligopeptidase PreP (S9A serine peptidase family)